MARKK